MLMFARVVAFVDERDPGEPSRASRNGAQPKVNE
jgi:hypothetical protein